MDEKKKGAIGLVGSAMVKSEMEAAEALANLARMQKWNLQEVGESSNHQVKTESLCQHESVAIHTAASCLSSGSAEDGVGGQPQYENIYPITTNRANIVQDAMLHKPITRVTRSHAYLNCSKSRHKMTEEEKEARRIRRVLANRESARQTIRRRQALYEELIRKAASLAQENESLKMEMDLAVQEYSSLKTTNESLRLQRNVLVYNELISYFKIVKAVSSELDESQADTKQINTEMLTSSPASFPYVIYSQPPPSPFIWPAFVQPSPTCQTQNLVNFYPEQLNTENKDVPNLPLYFLPSPIFYPVPNHGAAPPLGPFLDPKNEQYIIPTSYSYVSSSSTTTAGYGFDEVKREASNSKTTHEVPFNCQEGPLVLVKRIASVKPVPCQQSEFISTHQETPSTMPNALDTMDEKKLDLNLCPSKKHTDAAVVAAEARKRRKELTKLKSLHARDFRRG